ncbi:cob(I)yrinic acid a,c-diamide adenosyltransferase [Curvivirga aplysinae]|uniref:cob(I)yrinic acid a,c-diamide adenosyltransferase n=1 Tax=Curvivirga aplysinae TaxID=2529852 RepID=UPI0012BBAFD8|nr:cob(I)yrinic acid a,c-diamide adenosyltransferase [Curvivirga aplysinae]MTI11299.1 cob(I)yrinic acid a,c-diamide adenosyltransferase [Curvivirga aplysinae]
MVSLTKIYTRGGDKGETSLGDGSRRSKANLRVEAYGTVDEANACVGLIRLQTTGEIDTLLGNIQNDLFDLGADLCRPEGDEAKNPEKAAAALRISATQVEAIETACDKFNEDLADLTSFILPGGTKAGAYMHLARTVTRRAERLCVALAGEETINPEAVKYLNRLSDLFFVLSRYCNDKGKNDVLWVPGANR